MSEEQQELWLRAAVDALQGIRAEEVAAVSAEVRRFVTRHNQIVPKIADLVAANRARNARIREAIPVITGPAPKQHIADRDRRTFVAADWAELNEYLERIGATKRYHSDGTRYDASPGSKPNGQDRNGLDGEATRAGSAPDNPMITAT